MAADDIDPAEYVDLTLTDVTAAILKARAIQDVQTKFPDYVHRENTIEAALIDAFVVVIEELGYNINRLPGAVFEILLRHYGMTRDPGTPPAATMILTLSDQNTHTIPAGTRFRLVNDTLDPPLELTLAADYVAAGGQTIYLNIPLVGTEARADANGIIEGPLEVLDAIPYVESAELAGAVYPVTGGRDPETVEQFLTRGVALLSRLASTLVLPEHFAAAAQEEPYVVRALAVDNYDPAQTPPQGRAGHITVVAAGTNGAALSAGNKALLETKLEDMAVASLDIHLADPTITTVTVAATVTLITGAVEATVETAVVAALAAYLNPATWPFASTVFRNEIIALVDRTPGVDLVTNVTLNGVAADLTLPGVGPLVTLGGASGITV